MAGWNHDKVVWKSKSCVVCSVEFTPKSGVNKFCSKECKGKWKYVTGVASTENQYKLISGDWKRYLSRLMYFGGRKRDLLSREILLEVLEKQDYRCALSGLPMTCHLEKGKKFPYNVSVDRIEAGGPYSKKNIQLVCHALNHWRADTPVEDFVSICGEVYKFNKAKEECEVQDG